MSLSIIKESYKIWRETSELFWGDNSFFWLFLIAVIFILYFENDKIGKATYVYYSIIVLLGLYNPITYYLCNRLFNGNYAYFTRLYSLLPVPFTIAYFSVLLIEKIKGWSKLVLFSFIVGIIVLGGTNIYNEDWVRRAENFSKLSNDVVEVCEIVHSDNERIRLAAPSNIAVSIRQFDGTIMLAYGRYYGYNEPLRGQLDLDFPDVDKTLQLAGEYACDYIVVQKNVTNYYSFTQKGQELYGETENYYVFKILNIPRIKFVYDKYSRVVEKRYLDCNGELVIGENEYAVVRYEYDSSGNKIKETFFDEEEKPVIMPSGNAGTMFSYNKKHQVIRTTYIDKDGYPVMVSNGFASIAYKSNKNHDCEEYYYDNNGEPIKLNLGQYGASREYDSSGRVISISYINEKGISQMTYLGYYKHSFVYDEFGHVISEYYLDTEDKPVELTSGQSGVNYKYDENDYLVSSSYIDVDGAYTSISSGYSIINYDYDEFGNRIEEHYYDEDNTPTRSMEGIYGKKYTYNDQGQLETVCYLDVDDSITRSQSGYTSIYYEYDKSGCNTGLYYYDSNGNPQSSDLGDYGYNIEYNYRKQKTAITYVDKNRQPINTKCGYSTIKYDYDRLGNVKEETYYNKDNEPVKGEFEEYGKRYNYDDQNLVIEIDYIDKEGELIETNLGYSIVKREYDSRRHVRAEYYYNKEDIPVISKEGYYGFFRESNLYDQDTSITYLDKNYEPMEIGEKNYSNIKFFYDGNHELTTKIYYNLKGEEVDRIDYQTWDIKQHSDDSNNQGLFYTLKNTVTGSLIVIDGGSTENTNHVREVINSLGGTVDAWIVTHYHEDHAGAYNAIQADPQGIDIKKVYASKFDSDYEKFLEVAKYWDDLETMETWMNNSANADNVYYPDRGESITIDNLKLTFLNTYDEKLLELNGESDLPNNCALVTLIEGNEDSMLFMSDMYSPAVGDYLKQEYGDELKGVKNLQPCHHGNSIMPYDFYEFIDPDVMFFDAPEWLIEGDDWNAKGLKEWCEEKGISTYDYRTAPNSIQLR